MNEIFIVTIICIIVLVVLQVHYLEHLETIPASSVDGQTIANPRNVLRVFNSCYHLETVLGDG